MSSRTGKRSGARGGWTIALCLLLSGAPVGPPSAQTSPDRIELRAVETEPPETLKRAKKAVKKGIAKARDRLKGKAGDPLPSWRDGAAKQRIVAFVAKVTDPKSPDFVAPDERIAVFDNDGTLWSEKPITFQIAFAMDRVKALAPSNPEWKRTQPFKAALEGDGAVLLDEHEKDLPRIVLETHSGMTAAEFRRIVTDWLETARHPRFERPYTELVFQPMLEVLDYFRANGFKTFIVSGGGTAFMRPWAPQAYGIPPEQIVGSHVKLKFEMRDGRPVLLRLPEIGFLNNEARKPVAIQRFIGRRPIAAFGNSGGDLQMLQWTAAAPGPSLKVIIHHTDGEREWAYDGKSKVGKLEEALKQAEARHWTVVDMKRDWAVIYPFQRN